ncbi:hypothetical protein COLO4_13370 [Corchorus olitorius]|uniref:alpha-mannosidase n=1 Tax=Corchorus olitorius TaxID=93759 RepID=A0A1R3JWT6_9ROSI|nr:hypothetical protein COLO4_13370 [Corchorus olitorius]
MGIVVWFLGVLLLSGVLCAESKYMVYNTSAGIVDGKINVHLVPHTHDDVGWLKTVDQYYGACIQNVLDSVVSALLADKNRKFIYAFFQRWWREQSELIKSIVKKLVSSGQLEFINGGMCMHDEAVPHYIDMIDQTTLGHRFIKEEFGVTPRIGWQIDPFGHSAVQAYLLGSEVGFDAFYFTRIDYQDRIKRKNEKSLEVIWQGSKSLGSSAQIFAGATPENYAPPSGFSFEVNEDSLIVQDDINLFDYNVEDRVNDFVAAALSQANITRTNHIMWTMGEDFKYQYAHTWFRQLDKLIHYVNKDGRVNALYSTPSIYTDAKYAMSKSWPLKTDDYFPYADNANSYWTGYFTSRPALKGYVRIMSGYYLAARQLEFFKGRSSSGPNTDSLADALAIAQHHDAVTGTERQHVADDYTKRLSMGYVEAEKVVASSLACLADSKSSYGCEDGDSTINFQQCPLLNITYCPASETDLSNGKNLIVVVYNSLGWKREDVIRFPVVNEDVIVHDSEGREIESQLIPPVDAYVDLRNYYVRAYLGSIPNGMPKYWLAFKVSVPPLGFSTYTISTSKRTGAGSTKSSIYKYQRSEESAIQVGQGNLKLTISVPQGKIVNYVNSRNLVEESVEQSFSFYTGYDGTHDKEPQNSGAYIFRPNGTYLIKAEQALTVIRGPRLLLDDSRGVAEALNETVCVLDDCRGLTIQGKYYYRIDPLGEGAKWRRSFGQEIYSPLLLAFAEEELDVGKVLLRVELKKLFPDKKIVKVTEMSLSANQERSEMEKKRLVWEVEGSAGENPKVVRGRPVDPNELVVELAPMEIRTFLIDIDQTSSSNKRRIFDS